MIGVMVSSVKTVHCMIYFVEIHEPQTELSMFETGGGC